MWSTGRSHLELFESCRLCLEYISFLKGGLAYAERVIGGRERGTTKGSAPHVESDGLSVCGFLSVGPSGSLDGVV